MASYHFRVKTDTKSDGTRISASVHVDYIAREGKYKNEGTKKNFETNFIAFANTKNLGEETFPLYLTDDFGKIFYTPKGLQVSGKYSPTTLSIALTLAKNMSNNQPLILQGSQKFKKATLKTAVDSEMELTFADENFQRSFNVTKARKKFEERKFEEQGVEKLSQIAQSPSPTLKNLTNAQLAMLPTQDLICKYCPQSLWLMQSPPLQLVCFCRVMNLISWSREEGKIILQCDGIFQANNET